TPTAPDKDPSHAWREIFRRTSPFGSLRLEIAEPPAIRQEITLFGDRFETLTVTPAGARKQVRPLDFEGSPRLCEFLGKLRTFRCQKRWSDAELLARAADHEAPTWPSLRAFEQEVGGLVAPPRGDPLSRPELMLGPSICWNAPAVLIEDWTFHDPETQAEGSQ